jgi:translation initiation factor IF-3
MAVGNFKRRDEAPLVISNEKIRYSTLRVQLPDGDRQIMSRADALSAAHALGLDLILVTEQADPPVCRIIDVNKYLYEIKQKEKETKKRQRESIVEQKEIRLGLNIGQHDLDTKARHAKKFLEGNAKVTVTVVLRGRERGRQDLARDLLNTFADILEVEYEQVSSQQNKVIAKIK